MKLVKGKRERVAVPLTFLLKQEGSQWVSLSPEITVSSLGRTVDEARQGLKDAIETYVSYMISEGRVDEIGRQMPESEVKDFLADPPGQWSAEEHVLLISFRRVDARSELPSHVSFVRSLLPAHATRSLAS